MIWCCVCAVEMFEDRSKYWSVMYPVCSDACRSIARREHDRQAREFPDPRLPELYSYDTKVRAWWGKKPTMAQMNKRWPRKVKV